MFKPFQVVEVYGVHGIVTKVDGHYVTIMWEEGTHEVSTQTANATQWMKSPMGVVA